MPTTFFMRANFFVPRYFSFLFTVILLFGTSLSQADAQDTVRLHRGGQKSLAMEDLQRVAIANDKIADVRVIADGKELLIIGLEEGSTDITIWKKDGSQKVIRILVGKNIEDLTKEINTLLSDVEGVSVKAVGDKVVLDGEVLTADDKARIDKITGAYPEVLSLITVSTGAQSNLLEAAISKAINMPAVKVKVIGSKAILEGSVFSKSD